MFDDATVVEASVVVSPVLVELVSAEVVDDVEASLLVDDALLDKKIY